MPDLHANFAYSTVAVAPSPALSGTSLTVQAGDGSKFPAAPFNVNVWPANAVPLASNAEIARCTVKVGDVLTIVRTTNTESPASGNRAILVGDQIACAVTKKTLLDIEYDTVISPTDVGTLNNYNPGLSGHTLILLGNATLATITGFAGGITGQRVTVMSTAAGQIDFSHNDAGSTQKFSLAATSGKTSIAPSSGGIGEFYFDGTLWRLKHHEQGAWITPAFAAGHFTGSGAMTWTVSSVANRIDMRYRLSGRTLSVSFYLSTTTVGGTPSNHLIISNAEWGGFSAMSVASSDMRFPIQVIDNSVRTIGFAATGAAQGVTTIDIYKADDTTAWSVSAGNTYAIGSFSFEVQ